MKKGYEVKFIIERTATNNTTRNRENENENESNYKTIQTMTKHNEQHVRNYKKQTTESTRGDRNMRDNYEHERNRKNIKVNNILKKERTYENIP